MKKSCMMESFASSSASLSISIISEAECFFLPASDFGRFFVISIDFFDLRRSASACIGAWALRRFLRAIATEVSLFFASETLACFHELRSLICVNPSDSRAAWGGVHGVGVIALFVIPSRFPLLRGLRLFA